MRLKWLLLLCLGVALCGHTAIVCRGAIGAPPTIGAPPSASPAADAASPDEQAIRRNADLYVKAFDQRDAKALAALWAPKAVYVNQETGRRYEGRAAIEAALTTMFKKADKVRLQVNIQSIRFITPTVAIEDGVATVIKPDEEPEESNYTAIHVKHGDKWLLDSVRETVLPPPASAAEHLKPLEWLVGQWVDQDPDDDTTIHSTYNWTANRAFLTHAFAVHIGDRVDMRGMQIIAWDPAAKRIRSWAFDSDGGFAEGSWEQDGDRWVIHSQSTLPNGKKGTAINVLRKADDDHYTWKSTAREVDGEMLPNIDEVEIAREDADDSAADDKPETAQAAAPQADRKSTAAEPQE